MFYSGREASKCSINPYTGIEIKGLCAAGWFAAISSRLKTSRYVSYSGLAVGNPSRLILSAQDSPEKSAMIRKNLLVAFFNGR
jgi:hypothetical protein